jgi:Ca2+-dependent lipid-binding protein
MHLNHGKFRENGECGYVLKPEYMFKAMASPSKAVVLKVHLISGQQLPKPGGARKGEVIDPYVSLAVYGSSLKEPVYQHSTVVENNGFNPAWDEIFEFDISDPDVAQLYMKVMDSDLNQDDFIAYSSTPISSLLPGYRNFKLFDEKGNGDGDFSFAALFARITIE